MKDQTKVNLIACAFILAAILLMILTFSSCKEAKPNEQIEPIQVDTNTYINATFNLKVNHATYFFHIRKSNNKYLVNEDVTNTKSFTTKVIKGDSLFYSLTFNQSEVWLDSRAYLTITFDSLIHKVDTIHSTQFRRVWLVVK